ncbi:MAG: hypothetical protein JW846_09600 [Dehalococcoidia bacterium]|nr:hypothetical protein [Dehalococcoidia bacterium]
MDVRPLPEVVLKHFTDKHVISGWDVLEAHIGAPSLTAATFIDALLERMPFPAKAFR